MKCLPDPIGQSDTDQEVEDVGDDRGGVHDDSFLVISVISVNTEINVLKKSIIFLIV